MLPLLARKYVYRYIVLAFALPLLARLCLYTAATIEKRNGAPTRTAKGLRKFGAFTQRRSNRALDKTSGGT
ncbi:hypothetical protein BH09ACT7_BH09ACT7_53880 [soil metagenome]